MFDEINSQLKQESQKQNGDSKDDYDEDDEPVEPTKTESELSQNQAKTNLDSEAKRDSDGFAIPQLPLVTTEDKTPEAVPFKEIKKLDTPLGAMLPSKYADADVTDLFPEFRHNKVLRFSRLFQRNKKGVYPQIWRGSRNMRKNKQFMEAHFSQEDRKDNQEDAVCKEDDEEI